MFHPADGENSGASLAGSVLRNGISYREDASRTLRDNAAMNFSSLVKMTLTMLKRDKTTRVGIRSKDLKAGWNNDHLFQVLNL